MANTEKKSGSVLVVGAGIAGMQAALDCANAGFKVYLLEEKPAIGGNMARLDKTFPTNDCAMCMISPKLVETGRHLNIEIISYADLKKVEGQAGDFTVTVRKRPRYVDEAKCNGCGDCERACPVTMKDSFNGELGERKAIYRLYPQAIPNVFTIDKKPAPPPCRGTCPAGVNAQGYIALIAKGEYLRALDVVRERMPFAGTCGRICHHPCESTCNRARIDAPVSVRNLKRFVADYERNLMLKGQSIQRPPSEEVTPEKQQYIEPVAVIGGGPAGLTCAADLARLGYPVTVFDANAKPGGVLLTGIPEYRLPKEYLEHEISLLTAGVEMRPGQALGRDFTLEDLKRQGYKSAFIATGAQLARRIPLEGSEARGVLYGIDFLREVNTTGRATIGKEIVVIGGGNVAMDVARAALRVSHGGHVSLFCLESRAEMPAHPWEIKEAEEEGVGIHPSWGPARVTEKKGTATGMEMVRCLSVFDAERRFAPRFNPDEKMRVPADTIILAIGQACDASFLEGRIETERGLIKADRLTLETSLAGIFAGGDNVLGPASLVQAVEQGHRGAESIHRYLRGWDLNEGREPVERPAELAPLPEGADLACLARQESPQADPHRRVQSFLEIDSGYTPEAAQAEARRCLQCGGCSVCRECVRVCKARAIDHQMLAQERRIKVGAVIVSGGYDLFDAGRKSEYGFGRYPNVVTSLQFERILSASGPTQGHLRRPGDGAVPRKIAWIQCVGSRDVTVGNDYCSSVCCMYATKAAIIAMEHEPGVEPTIFFIDMRAFGKGFEGFYNRARETYGVRMVRSQVSTVKENPANGNPILRYVGEGNKVVEEEFDLVVLSVGLVRHHALGAAAGVLGIECNRFGFAQGQPLEPQLSSREGIFLCGAVSGPKDIPETVMEASAAAARVGELLQAARGSEVKVKEYPVERVAAGEEPRIGVFVCHCGSNIASVIDVKGVSEYARSLPGVVYAEHTIYTCSQDTQERIKEIIREQGLNRVIVASCTPRTHQPLFQETLREAGLNKHLFEMADIREQCSWVHQQQHEEATAKARDLVRGSVAKSSLLEPLQFKKVPVTRAALVLGGGMAGMAAAVSLSRQGFQVHLVEKSGRLGGNLHHLRRSLEGHDLQDALNGAITRVLTDSNIRVHLESEIDEVSGFVGNFVTRLKGASSAEVRHGAIIVATGAGEFKPAAFLYGASPRVLTQRELEARVEDDGFAPRSVVMIQCVGSRDKEHPWCSRVCCSEAVKNALAIKARDPRARVTVLYRDIRTYQFKETYYRQAREAGVIFIRFPDERYPEVSETTGGICVAVHDALLGETLKIDADLLVLSAATVPDREDNRRLGELLKVPLSEDGFFMEAHVKLRPVDFATEGIFVCGLAHSPKSTEENITQALAAAGRAATILSRDSLEVGGAVSVVDPDKCATCLTCLRECIYNAPFVNADGKAEIEGAKCQGCGNCASACPGRAIQLRTFTDLQERALFHAILKKEG